MAQVRESSPRRIAALDGLRGLAVAAVLLFHGGYLDGGFLGVDLFFVLSGYLITGLLLREWNAHRSISLGRFWGSRARRLFPALLLAGFVVVIGSRLFATSGTLADLRGDLLGTLTYTANWRFIAQGTSYWANLGPPSPLQHVWSLAIEEQFYLLWPLVVIGLLWYRRNIRSVLVVAVALAAASSIWMAVSYSAAHSSRAYFGTDTHAAPILIGAALAVLLELRGPARGHRERVLLEGGALIGFGAVVAAWFLCDGEMASLYRGGFLLFALAGALVIAAVTHPSPGHLGRALSWRPICWLGLISYGLYLFHWPVYLWLTPQQTGMSDGIGLLGVRLAVTFALAIASFVLLEQPIRRRQFSASVLRVAAPVSAVVLVVALVVVTAGARSTSETLGTIADRGAPPPVVLASTTRAMVVGDSMSLSVGTGLASVADPANLEVWKRGLAGCGLIRSATQFTATVVGHRGPECVDYRNQWRADIGAFDPTVVVLVASAWDLFDRNVGGQAVRFGTAAWDRLYRTELTAVLTLLARSGAEVQLLTLPYIDVDSPFLQPWYRPAFTAARVRHLNRVVKDVAAQHGGPVQTVDLNAFLGPRGKYTNRAHGIDDLRGDGIHLSPAGQTLVGNWLSRSIDPQAGATSPVGESQPHGGVRGEQTLVVERPARGEHLADR